MKLLRLVILLATACLFLPAPPGGRPPQEEAGARGSACGSLALLCEAGGALVERVETRVAYSAWLLWNWARGGGTAAPRDAGPFAAVRVEADGPASPAVSAPRGEGSGRSTLELEDLVPEWRGPGAEPRKDG